MFLPQAPSARATPSPLVDIPGRPAILHCAKDRSIPRHTIRIIGCGVVPFLYVYSRSLLILYGNPFVCQCGAPREWRCMVFNRQRRGRVSRRRSSRPVRLGVCCFNFFIGGSHGVREIFDSLGFRSTEHSGRVRVRPPYVPCAKIQVPTYPRFESVREILSGNG